MVTVLEPELKSRHLRRARETQKLVDELFNRISLASSLPAAATRILEVTANPRSEGEDLVRAIEGDPAIAAGILRIVNSSLHSPRNGIGDLKTASALLGFGEIRNLALTACVSSFFGTGGNHGDYSREALWNHGTGVGAAATIIAKNSGRGSFPYAYVAGLLHDLGLILIDRYLHRPFCDVLDNLTRQTPTCAVELAVLGFEHTELGSNIARRWRFPDEVTAAIRYHHEPEQYDGPYRDMVYIVAMANFLCTLYGLTSLGVRNVPEPPNEVIDALNFRPDNISSFGKQLEKMLAQASVTAGTCLVA